MILEMFAKPEKHAQSFDLNTEFTKQPEVRVLLANQGIYNGMLGLSILASFWLFYGNTQLTVQLLLLTFIAVVALYGGFTSTRKIWLLQMLPAIIGFFAPNLSRILPLTGESAAPIRQPGSNRHPARNASCPETICA